MTVDTKEILVKTRELIQVPERWTQGTYAKTADNGYAELFSSQASKFCILGALAMACGIGNNSYEAWKCLASAVGPTSPGQFNDTHTHAEVLDLLDRVIAKL